VKVVDQLLVAARKEVIAKGSARIALTLWSIPREGNLSRCYTKPCSS
jgi:hypothetical protein